MTTKEQAISAMLVLMNDCDAQINALKDRNDVDWDCYNQESWREMLNQLGVIRDHLTAEEPYEFIL